MFADPIKNLKSFGFREDMIVADLGAGTGFYTLPLAQILSMGKVYAVEIDKDFLKTIQNKVHEMHLSNVDIILGNVEERGGTKIGDEKLDAVIASNILFQIEDKGKFVNEIKRILKIKGKVLLIDWKAGSPIGPKSDHIVPESKAKELFLKNNFVFEREIDAGEYHYGMILERQI